MTASDSPTPDSDKKPNVPPTEGRRPLPGDPRGDRSRGPRPQRDKPNFQPGKPPDLTQQELPNADLRLRDLDAAIEAELQAAMAEMSDKDFLPAPDTRNPMSKEKRDPKGPKKGRVVSIHSGDVFVEIVGNRSQGVIPLLQFAGSPAPKVGEELEFDVERYDSANGLLILTRKGAVQHVDWSSVAVNQVVEARVTAVNKGGLTVEVNGIRGFLPMGQIDMYRVEHPEEYLNQRLRCIITEASPEERNLVVSRRVLLEREREEQREKFWATVEEGQVRDGIVRNIKPFGVFVDLGGADGMVPVSELSWARVATPEQLVSIGQKVQVKVVRIDTATRKISLSLRALAASPWDAMEDRIRVGSTVTGKITRVADFGAFVELNDGIEGLIHISELGTQRIRRVRDVVSEGQEVTVQVLSIDPATRRIGLSLKAVLEAAQRAEASANAPAQEPEPEPTGPEAPKVPRDRSHLRGGLRPGPLIPPMGKPGSDSPK